MRRDVFQAIADPTRREILGMVAHDRLNINAVTSQFEVSRMAIYKHIRILAECGLLEVKQQGRERFCEARLDKLREVADWVVQYEQFWTSKLDALEAYLKKVQPGPRAPAKKHARKTSIGKKATTTSSSSKPTSQTKQKHGSNRNR